MSEGVINSKHNPNNIEIKYVFDGLTETLKLFNVLPASKFLQALSLAFHGGKSRGWGAAEQGVWAIYIELFL